MTKQQSRVISTIFIILVLLFFGFYLRNLDYSRLRDVGFNLPLLILASLCSLGFRYWGVFIWRHILSNLGSSRLPRFGLLSAIYAKAWMGRYIPGGITWIAGKVYLASSIGISKSRLTVASLVEAAVQIIALTVVSGLLIGFDARSEAIPLQIKGLLLLFALGLMVMLHPALFNRVLRGAYKLVRRKDAYDELQSNGRTIVRSFALYAFGSFISGTAFFLLARSLEPSIDWSLYLYLVGTFNLSGAIGMAIPFLPSGIGVREGVQLALLSAVLPTETALVITVISRLWSAIIDVVFYVLATGLNRAKVANRVAT